MLLQALAHACFKLMPSCGASTVIELQGATWRHSTASTVPFMTDRCACWGQTYRDSVASGGLPPVLHGPPSAGQSIIVGCRLLIPCLALGAMVAWTPSLLLLLHSRLRAPASGTPPVWNILVILKIGCWEPVSTTLLLLLLLLLRLRLRLPPVILRVGVMRLSAPEVLGGALQCYKSLGIMLVGPPAWGVIP